MRYVFKGIPKKNWAGISKKFPGTKNVLTCPVDSTTGYYKTGLTNQQKEELGKELGVSLEPSTLNKFWRDFTITFVEGQDKVVDTDTAIGKIEFSVLSQHPSVAMSKAETYKDPKYMYVLADEEKEAVDSNKTREIKAEAYSLYMNLTIEEMIDVMVLLGKYNQVKNASPSVVRNRLGDFIDGGKENQIKLVNALKDPLKNDRILLERLLNERILRKNGSVIYYGEDQIGASDEEAIEFIKGPKNSKVKQALMAALEK